MDNKGNTTNSNKRKLAPAPRLNTSQLHWPADMTTGLEPPLKSPRHSARNSVSSLTGLMGAAGPSTSRGGGQSYAFVDAPAMGLLGLHDPNPFTGGGDGFRTPTMELGRMSPSQSQTSSAAPGPQRTMGYQPNLFGDYGGSHNMGQDPSTTSLGVGFDDSLFPPAFDISGMGGGLDFLPNPTTGPSDDLLGMPTVQGLFDHWMPDAVKRSTRLPLLVEEYTGDYRPAEEEFLLLFRDTNNIKGFNTIKLLAANGQSIGYIPEHATHLLASSMDSMMIQTVAVVTGPTNAGICPIDVLMDGIAPSERELINIVSMTSTNPITAITARSIQFLRQNVLEYIRPQGDSPSAYPGYRTAEAQFFKMHSMSYNDFQALFNAVSTNTPVPDLGNLGAIPPMGPAFMNPFALDSSSPFPPPQFPDPVRRMQQVFEKAKEIKPRGNVSVGIDFGVKIQVLKDMPKADQPESIATKLLPYQLQGLKWLLDQENPQLPEEAGKTAHLWTRLEDGRFQHVITGFVTPAPEMMRGGILADDMGLGKTLQTISLISEDWNKNCKKSGGPKTTLIAAPLSVMSVWRDQINQHSSSMPGHQLKVLLYHGPAKKNNQTPDKLKHYDVVITTYNAIQLEAPKEDPEELASEGLFSLVWRRVVLDEGHFVRNPSTKSNKAVCKLSSWSRWVLTGTPIVNKLTDLYALLKFLRISGGLDDSITFREKIEDSVGTDRPGIRDLMSTICLRRMKDMSFIDLKLPPLKEYIIPIKFSKREQEVYDFMQSELKGALKEYTEMRKIPFSGANEQYRNVLSQLLRMRQHCNHPKLCGEAKIDAIQESLKKLGVVHIPAEKIKELLEQLQHAVDDEKACELPSCGKNMQVPSITTCGHNFCLDCIQDSKKCPVCESKLTTGDIIQLDLTLDPVDASESSSKVEALIKLAKDILADPDGGKIVIFSQWTQFLNLLEPRLQEAGIEFTRIDGAMKVEARDVAINALNTKPNCRILLASLAVCSVGLNLVAANYAILADSWWAPAIEDQAVDRIHRLGQKRETKVFRLIMEGSVERGVLKTQEKKRDLMQTALSDETKRGAKTSGASLGDIQTLLGMSNDTSSDEEEEDSDDEDYEPESSAMAAQKKKKRETETLTTIDGEKLLARAGSVEVKIKKEQSATPRLFPSSMDVDPDDSDSESDSDPDESIPLAEIRRRVLRGLSASPGAVLDSIEVATPPVPIKQEVTSNDDSESSEDDSDEEDEEEDEEVELNTEERSLERALIQAFEEETEPEPEDEDSESETSEEE